MNSSYDSLSALFIILVTLSLLVVVRGRVSVDRYWVQWEDKSNTLSKFSEYAIFR